VGISLWSIELLLDLLSQFLVEEVLDAVGRIMEVRRRER